MRLVVLSALAVCTVAAAIRFHLVARGRPRALALQLGLDICALIFVVLAIANPALFEAWMQEDAWAEWCTVFVFAGAAALHVLRIIRPAPAPIDGWLPKLAVVAVAAFCLFVAGEEISWGQRLIGFAPPEIFLEENFQQELNVHNLLTNRTVAGFSLDSRFMVALVAIAFGGALPALHRWAKLGPLSPAIAAIAPPAALLPWFLAVAFVELSYPADLVGEACELGLGLLFLIAAVTARFPAALFEAAPLPGRQVALWLFGPICLGLVLTPLITRLVYGDDDALVAIASAELNVLRDDLVADGVLLPKLLSKGRVHKRVFTAAREYFDLSRGLRHLDGESSPATPGATNPRRDRKGYFLDPWNNPYWILVTKQSENGLLYSFGPNRRRDTRLPKRRIPEGFQAVGDDIVVEFLLPPRNVSEGL